MLRVPGGSIRASIRSSSGSTASIARPKRAEAGAPALLAGQAVVKQLDRRLFAREEGERDWCFGRDPGRLPGQAQRRAVAAERVDEAVRLGVRAGPHPALGDRLDRVGAIAGRPRRGP